MFGGFNQGQLSNFQIPKIKLTKTHTSNPANLVSIVGGKAGPNISVPDPIIYNKEPIVDNNQSGNKGINKKKKRNRGGKNKRWIAPLNTPEKIQGLVRPNSAANMNQNKKKPESRIDLPFDRRVIVSPRDHNTPNKNPNPLMPKSKGISPGNQQKPKSLLNQENVPENFRFTALPRYIHMNVGTTIYLDTFSSKIYGPGKTDFDRALLSRPDMWHQFVVHHNGKFNKKEILTSLFALVRLQELFPIGYRQYELHDVFLLTASDRAGIEIIFNKNLKLRIRDSELCVSVQLGAGQIVMGQVHPKAQIILMCQELLENATLHGNNQCLNLEGFERHSALSEVCISFANSSHLVTVVKSLIDCEHSIGTIKGIKFANCGIDRIDSFRHLSNFTKLEYIDLRNNQLESVLELKHLEKLNLTRLDVAGNPFAEKEELTHLQERIKKALPTLKLLDGLELMIRPKLEPGNNGEDLEFDIMLDGEPITVDDNLNAINTTFKQRYRTSNYWHKVTVFHQGQYNRKQIVSKLLALVENNDLWPCYYSSTHQYDEFYVHNNLDALEILVRNKLFIKSTGNEAPLQLMLTMNVSPFKVGQVEIIEKIQRICLEGFTNKTLNLNSLADREIFNNVIIDMSSPRVVSQIILWASRKVGQQCTTIHLNNNGIVSCAGMYPLCWFTKLEVLNMRNNQIETFERLCGIPQPNKICSVFFEGNPLCNSTLQQYVKNIKHYFPDVQTIDGAPVTGDILMLARQNYLSKPESYTFVESFIKHYFTIYDSNQKHMLKELYMDKAMFTMSSNFDLNRSKEVSRMSKYTSKSRNIIRLVNLDQSTRNVFIGPEEIIKILIDLHSTEHDFMSFCIDVPIHTKTFIVITIDGVFKDKAIQFLDDEFLIHFTRSFTIRSCGSGMGVSGISQQFKIQNDLLLVRNVSTQEKLNAFEETPNRDEEPNEEMTENEMENLIVVFQEMTRLNKQWCTQLLQEANWKFNVGLNLCVKLLENGDIPEDAFTKS